MKKGKACGPDQIPNEVLKAGGDALCSMVHELLVKAVAAAREPLQWKAGIAVPLYKRGAVSNPDNYRFGGRKGCGTGFGHHMLQSVASFSGDSHMSSCAPPFTA